MPRYTITTDGCELPRWTRFYLLRPAPVLSGQLALATWGDSQNAQVGRWFPSHTGRNLFLQSDRGVVENAAAPIRVLGAIVLAETPPKPIVNLPAREYDWIFTNPPAWARS